MNLAIMRAVRILPFFFFLLIFNISCGSDPLDIDTSSVTVDPVKVQRIDEDFYKLDTSKLVAGVAGIRTKYGIMTDCFLNNVICFASPDSSECYYTLSQFLTDHTLHGAWDMANEKYKDGFAFLESDLTGAYTYFSAHFPERKLPKGVFIVFSGFNYNYISCDGYYAIGMDYFLGQDNLYYQGLQWPMYKRRTLEPGYMAAGFVRAWMMNEFPFASGKMDVLNRIVYEGKIMYLQQALLRETPDSIITGFTQAQLDWCEASEADVWAKMIEESVVYSENEEDLNHMTMDAPFTAGFPKESPGRVGTWIGLRIVQTYMDRFPETTLEELMAMNDAQLLLTQSKYKPSF
jgi:hypothetical protein